MAPAVTVGVLMGSDSDLPTMAETVKILEGYGVATEVRVLSAHRTPEEATRYAREAEGRGLKVLIAGAGGAAHLAGALAAHSTLPVIGVPLESSPLSGFDALLATVQMPPGIPVATVGVGAMGARMHALRGAGCDAIVMLGKVPRQDTRTLDLDAGGLAMVPALLSAAPLGDDALLRAVMAEHERAGFRVVGVDEVMGDLLARAAGTALPA